MSGSNAVEGFVEVLPVALQLGEGALAGFGKAVVLAWGAGVGLLPFVVDEALAAQPGQQRVERSFLRREFRARQPLQHFRHVELFPGNDPEHGELQESLADGPEFLADFHGRRRRSYLSKTR